MNQFELDRPLQFHGDSEIQPQSCSPYNTTTLGVGSKIYDAANRGYTKSRMVACTVVHEYSPCKCLTPEEYELQKAKELCR